MKKIINGHLVTSSDKRTWKTDQHLLFIGQWCLDDRQNETQGSRNLDFTVADPLGTERINKDYLYSLARRIEDKLFPELCIILQEFHGLEYGARYWKILLGHWFRRFIDVIINRTFCLKQCINNYDLSTTTILVTPRFNLAEQNTSEGQQAFNDDRWNHEIYSQVLKLLPHLNIDLIEEQDVVSRFGSKNENTIDLTRRIKLKSKIELLSNKLNLLSPNGDGIFILESYLPFTEDILFQILNMQFPRFNLAPSYLPNSDINNTARSRLQKFFSNPSEDIIEKIIRLLLFRAIPICFIESFSEIRNVALQLPWPSKPKIIFTSNNFDTNELFKFWAGEKVVHGAKYVVGQHGNNYGSHRYCQNTVEEVTSDLFITWGWKGNLAQHTPAFCLKTAGLKRKPYQLDGSLLLVSEDFPVRRSVWDDIFDFNLSMSYQARFVGQLKEAVLGKLLIRLTPKFKNNLPDDVGAICKQIGDQKRVDYGDKKIGQLISKSRLVVFGYDSTGILENLALDMPTIAFWPNGLDHVRDSARLYYQRLIDVGIIQTDPEAAAKLVNEIWEDIIGWWQQPELIAARKTFNSQFARTVEHPKSLLRQLLISTS